ncbi:hypothetical protein Q8W71_27240 [Methylobacterium sp. NEAU 140]|uniref:hypothetical protein n=1 Tax=Methylobacterium sp. NEAU 140 TaxID=3064945 RepID=UPI0027376087|nr:hypothetical protein [Methylobacterium sp. NEAU 140]MDP4026323.1 hypothetical protein [Methylobacterium sp. NEAU 140]
MDELVSLLGGPPAVSLAGHLDRLERDAYLRGAPETTVDAIKSAQALVRLSEAPVMFVVRSDAIH